jgi:hypothetical protein
MDARSPELRIVATLAELLSQEGRPAEARKMLADVTARVFEGRDGADYQRAISLIEQLSRG